MSNAISHLFQLMFMSYMLEWRWEALFYFLPQVMVAHLPQFMTDACE